MLISSTNTFTDTPRVAFNQITDNLWLGSHWHIKLTITTMSRIKFRILIVDRGGGESLLKWRFLGSICDLLESESLLREICVSKVPPKLLVYIILKALMLWILTRFGNMDLAPNLKDVRITIIITEKARFFSWWRMGHFQVGREEFLWGVRIDLPQSRNWYEWLTLRSTAFIHLHLGIT